ncbi:cytochrome c biogenesis protein CcsA [Brooklawnia sp.]|uniref:cytochrome c biogenesis protein CcsA n=1 Tax=Brooklawnia sp. TaxID=2699740 RepID=UPI00311FE4BA
MLEISQALLVATTVLVVFAVVAYVVALLAARAVKPKSVPATVKVGAGAAAGSAEPRRPVAAAGDQITARPGRTSSSGGRGVAWYGGKFTQGALILLTGSLLARFLATGHAPFANHYEFAVSFSWGMILALVYFEHRYRVRTLAVVVLPVILAMLLYASTLSYAASPLMPALQNSPLLTLHVFTAALAYGAAVIAFGAAVMYLLGPHIKWSGWPKLDTLDDLGYKAVIITFPMLTIMIILGSVWANVAWGRYWSWDPKETAALVTWLIYGAYLHARVVGGWRGKRAAWLLVLGFAAIIFTYFGNLFFGGMHSYA